ncbi:hypothetical protein D9M71_531200 [compost metagenome]
MRCIQSQLGIAQITLAAMGGVVTLDTQEIDLIDQRLADTSREYRVLHQVIEARLRQPRKQLLLVDSLGQFFGKTTQTSQRTTRVDEQYGFGQAGEACQQVVAGAKELEVG